MYAIMFYPLSFLIQICKLLSKCDHIMLRAFVDGITSMTTQQRVLHTYDNRGMINFLNYTILEYTLYVLRIRSPDDTRWISAYCTYILFSFIITVKKGFRFKYIGSIWIHGYFQKLTMDPRKNNYIKCKTDKCWQNFNIQLHI